MTHDPKPPFPKQQQAMPGATAAMDPQLNHGETSYEGSGRLTGKKAIITGGDSGIGRESADVLISYLDEEDAQGTRRLIEEAGRTAVLVPGDIKSAAHCRVDVLVNNAAHQATFSSSEEISDEEWEVTFTTNVHAMFYLTKAALPHMREGAAIINTTSINADQPSPQLLAYATTKGAIHNYTAGLAQMLAGKGIRVNCVAPGPIWTPLIPSTMPPEKVTSFGANTPMGREGSRGSWPRPT